MDSLKKQLLRLGNSPRYSWTNFSLKSLFHLLCNYLLVAGALLLLFVIYCLVKKSDPANEVNRAPFHELTYIRSAYRISDTTIRLVIVRSVENTKNLTYEFGLKKGNIRLECHNEKCPDEFSPPCSINGFVGIIDDIAKNDRQSYLVVFTEGSETPLFVDVKDTRQKSAPKHELGVCVQPIYLHTDFTAFIQFFEFWLAENATKFYVYRESYTPEVGELLDFYANHSGVNFEFIDWTSLPQRTEPNENLEDTNPNRFWFRLEVFMSIFDCVHRSKGEVKFLAQLDLDEMLYVGPKRSIIEFMKAIDLQEPELAAVSFRSQRVQVLNKEWINVDRPSELSFENLETVLLEKKVFKRPLYSKMVYKPERAFRVHIHRQLQTEQIPGTDRTYKHVNIAPEGGVVLHIRRLTDMYKWGNATQSTIIQSKAQKMQKLFEARFKNFKSNITAWNNYGLEVNEKIEKCRQAMNRNRRNACHNLYDCDHQIKDVKWIRAASSWQYI
ncbi:protein of unknown function DUF23 domain-containing protein [Aphelenchoides bicaudatus]|nr:protein of unknown function DUF23 domain-containing protein [Aphelenchoides bicaudatus]